MVKIKSNWKIFLAFLKVLLWIILPLIFLYTVKFVPKIYQYRYTVLLFILVFSYHLVKSYKKGICWFGYAFTIAKIFKETQRKLFYTALVFDYLLILSLFVFLITNKVYFLVAFIPYAIFWLVVSASQGLRIRETLNRKKS